MTTSARLLGTAFLFSLAAAVGAAELGRKPQTAAPQAGAALATEANVFHSVQLQPLSGDAETTPNDGGKNRLGLITGEAAEQHARQMRERLGGPEQRAAMRAEQHATLQQHRRDTESRGG